MKNSSWNKTPLPDGRAVLVYFAKPKHGTRFGIRNSLKISNGYMEIIDGLFDFDSDDEIIAWKELSDGDLPLED